MEFVFAAETRPFAIAAALLLALVVIETTTLLAGFSLSHIVEKSLGHEGDGDTAGGMNWLNVGRVPLLVLLMITLGAFAAIGFAIQEVAGATIGRLPVLVAAIAAVATSVPTIRSLSQVAARIVPRDETYAVEMADLVGLVAEVTVGPLNQGLPGSVRLKDAHGNWHSLRARAAEEVEPMPTGSKVLLVDQSAGVFTAIPAPGDLG